MNAFTRMTMRTVLVAGALLVATSAATSVHAKPSPAATRIPVTRIIEFASAQAGATVPAGRPVRRHPARPVRRAQRHAPRRSGSRTSFFAVTPRAAVHGPRGRGSRIGSTARRDRAPHAAARSPESRGPPRASPRDPLAASLPARRDAAPELRPRPDAASPASFAPVAFHPPRRSSPSPITRDLARARHARAPP